MNGRVVIAFLRRALRATDNPALDAALRHANRAQKPVLALVVESAKVGFSDGLGELAARLRQRSVPLVVRAEAEAVHTLAAEVDAALVVADGLLALAPATAPLIIVEDEGLIARASLRAAGPEAARLLLEHELARGLSTPREPSGHRFYRDGLALRGAVVDGDRKGGERAAETALRHFVREELVGYAARRRSSSTAALGSLARPIERGHLGVRQVARAVLAAAQAPRVDRDAFVHDLLVERELALAFEGGALAHAA